MWSVTLTDSHEIDRAARRALDTLDRLDVRLGTHYAPRRRHHRRPLRVSATVRRPLTPLPTAQEVTVWTREISESGLSFVSAERIADAWVLIRLEPTPGQPIWVRADVVRRREVPSGGFWEHAVAFRKRIDEVDSESVSLT